MDSWKKPITDEPMLLEEFPEGWFVSKPVGWITVGGVDKEANVVWNWAKSNLSADALPVHRLDKQTSGGLILAKGKVNQQILSGYFQDRQVEKTYLVLLGGSKGIRPVWSCDEPLDGKKAKTQFERIQKHPCGIDWVKAKISTGRMHQIRRHASLLGTPVLGDIRYGGTTSWPDGENSQNPLVKIERVALHAFHVQLPKKLRFTAPLPEDFKQWLNILGLDLPKIL